MTLKARRLSLPLPIETPRSYHGLPSCLKALEVRRYEIPPEFPHLTPPAILRSGRYTMAIQYPSKYAFHQLWRYLLALSLIAIVFHALYKDLNNQRSHLSSTLPASTPLAAQIPARVLLSRPQAQDRTTIPKLIHQTWFPAGTNMSSRAQLWVQTMRAQNPDWEYILWDDETNRMLVEQLFPWFLPAYLALPKEILRADMVRNLYMYAFGGMYADVDTEALRPVEPLFASHAMSLATHQAIIARGAGANPSPPVQRAFLGRMSHSSDLQSSAAVPNGWMASPPGHPFWLLPVLYLLQHPDGTGDGSVEGLTGPGALSLVIEMYYEKFRNISARKHTCDIVRKWQPDWRLFCEQAEQTGTGTAAAEEEEEEEEEEEMEERELRDALVLLPRNQIYPFSWVDDRQSISILATSRAQQHTGTMNRDRPGKQESPWSIAFYIGSWVFWSNATILYNKWLLESTPFKFPIMLTTWHLIFATIATQLLAQTTTLLDSRKQIHMDTAVYCYRIAPIGVLYSGSLICSNMVYLYLNVSFAQILKASGPVVTLLTSWAWGVVKPSRGMTVHILLISFGVILTVTGEIRFSWAGIILQMAALFFDANRLVIIQMLLSDSQNMDPLVSLYYSAPVCALMNCIVSFFTEYQSLSWGVIASTGVWTLVLNAAVGFMLNISIFMLIGKTSGLTTTLISVPKNILLILISVAFWGTSISMQQAVGYTIALGAMLSYSINPESIPTQLNFCIWPWNWRGRSQDRALLPT
ncbi:hypothetical protein FE257_009649 [Aspergillus nanangensis]|uniref:Sugar phosphate transporter domain-containing protein n=1 Tax=Aspergillus nanangensis TaxID=2582783 RepID=A0AAD4GSL2_ASPNN|nr:hypothetical protein FE257_009649 [Aspergillus nanangensis]